MFAVCSPIVVVRCFHCGLLSTLMSIVARFAEKRLKLARSSACLSPTASWMTKGSASAASSVCVGLC